MKLEVLKAAVKALVGANRDLGRSGEMRAQPISCQNHTFGRQRIGNEAHRIEHRKHTSDIHSHRCSCGLVPLIGHDRFDS